MQVQLTKEEWAQLLSLAERGASVVCQQLSSQPGQLSQVAEVASKAAELMGKVQEQLND